VTLDAVLPVAVAWAVCSTEFAACSLVAVDAAATWVATLVAAVQ
jgi:hypothetical protein